MRPGNWLFKAYSYLPYLFFSMVAVCYLYSELAWGGISWLNTPNSGPTGYEHFSPFIDFFIFPAVAGLLLLPVITLMRFFRRRSLSRLRPALLSYSLLLGFLILAVYMGWWID